MIYNPIVVFDFETGGRDPHQCEPIQIAAVVINPQNLDFYRDDQNNPVCFESLMRPLYPEKLEAGALAVNKRTVEELVDAPLPEYVWSEFARFVKQWNLGGRNDNFSSPIPAGHNIKNFDMVIVDRLCDTYKIQRKNGEQGVFHNVFFEDTLQLAKYWLRSVKELNSYSLDSLRDYFGISKEGGHDALKDTIDAGEILIKFMNLSQRLTHGIETKNGEKVKVKFKNSFSKG